MSKFKINTGKLVLVAVAATVAGGSLLGTGQVYAQNYQQQSATTPLQREIAYTNTPSGAPRIEIMHVARNLGGIRPYYEAGFLTPEEGKLFVKYNNLFFGVMNSSTINPKWKDTLLTDYNKPYLFEKRQIEQYKRLTGGDKILRTTVMGVYFNPLVQSESRNPNPLLPDARTFRSSQSTVSDPQSVASNEPIVVNGNRKPQPQSSGSQSTANQSNQAPVINEGPGPYQRIYKDSGDPIRDRLDMNDDVFPVTREKVEKQGAEGLKILQAIYDDWDHRKDPSYLNGLKTKEDVKEYKTAMEEVQSAINLYKSILNKLQPQSSESQSPKLPEAKQINNDTSKGSGSFSSEDVWNKGNIGMVIVNFEDAGHNGVATFDVDSDIGKKLMNLPKNFNGELKYEFKDSTITPQMKKDFPGQFDGESSIQKIVKIVNISGDKSRVEPSATKQITPPATKTSTPEPVRVAQPAPKAVQSVSSSNLRPPSFANDMKNGMPQSISSSNLRPPSFANDMKNGRP
jgi:hypothetical protein